MVKKACDLVPGDIYDDMQIISVQFLTDRTVYVSFRNGRAEIFGSSDLVLIDNVLVIEGSL